MFACETTILEDSFHSYLLQHRHTNSAHLTIKVDHYYID